MEQLSELEAILKSASGQTVADALLQTTPSIAVIADSHGKILRVSRHACELSGLRAEEMEGLSIKDFFALVEPRGLDGRLLKLEQFPLARALKGRAQLGREGFFRDRRGERVPIVSNAAPFRSPSGDVALRQVAPDRVDLEIADDGVGFTPNAAGAGSQGVRLMRLIARRLGGNLTIAAGDGGARVRAQLPISIGTEPAIEKPA
jgi:PAS domain S-box-containing protein